MADKLLFATFLAAVQGVHFSGSGTKETSYYTSWAVRSYSTKSNASPPLHGASLL